jgi:ubiquinone/menaquinone biosynthesis C-methylase UbiE
MKEPNRRPEDLLGWMDCLADRTRLRLLRLLERHELGVVELCGILQLPQSTVSRHLKLLGDRGWVESRRRGTARLYRMRAEELAPGARPLWVLARGQIEGWATLAQDELRLRRALAGREHAVDDFFAARAGQWDRLRSQLYGEAFLLDAALALLPRDSVVVDMGCGTGFVATRLARHAARVLAVDGSAAMLKAAERRTAGMANVELVRADLSSMPIGEATADAALLILVLTYVEEPQEVLREAARVLKQGGRIVVVDLLPHDRVDFLRRMEHRRAGFPMEETRAMLETAGFSDAAVSSLVPEPAAKGPALFLARACRKGG